MATRKFMDVLTMVGTHAEKIDFLLAAKMLQPSVLRQHPQILTDMIAEILGGNYSTFSNACILSAILIRMEGGWGDVAKAVSQALFTSREDCFNPDRLIALRTILQMMEGKEKVVFFKKCFAEILFQVINNNSFFKILQFGS